MGEQRWSDSPGGDRGVGGKTRVDTSFAKQENRWPGVEPGKPINKEFSDGDSQRLAKRTDQAAGCSVLILEWQRDVTAV
jgi:hypothetical protein